MRYIDFELTVGEQALDGYPLHARWGDSTDTDDSTFDPFAAEFRALRAAVAAGQADHAALTDLGTRLFAALFEAGRRNVSLAFERCRGRGDARRAGVRLRLIVTPPLLAALPWELLYSRRDRAFLGTREATPLVRFLELSGAGRTLETPLPLRMLAVIPHSPDLDTAAERDALSKLVSGLGGLVELTFLPAADAQPATVTLDDLRVALSGPDAFHVLHFVGHGDFLGGRPTLALNDAAGGRDPVAQDQLGELLANHASLKLVVLNSCDGAALSSTEPLVGMAPALLQCGVPAVVAMQYAIRDDQARLFADAFYRSLFTSAARGRVDVAISRARSALAVKFHGDRVLGTPVLFTRVREGVLFDAATAGRRLERRLSSAAQARDEAIVRTRVANLPHLEGEERAREEDALRLTRQRIRQRTRWVASTAMVGALMVFASWFPVFDRLPADLKLEAYVTWLGDGLRDKRLDERIVLVGIDDEIDPGWRPRHAVLLERLSEAGARVVVFDVRFPRPAPGDERLAGAMRQARERGTAVVVGIDRLEGDAPAIAPALREAVAGWGVACLGGQDFQRVVPLLTRKREGATVPALALAAQRALEPARPPLASASGVDVVRSTAAGCPVIEEGDTVVQLITDTTPLGRLREPRRRLRYEDLVREGAFVASLAGKVVFVGEETPRETFPVFRGLRFESRYGYELHADALNTLLGRVVIRPLGFFAHLVVMAVMAALGALLWARDATPWRRRAALGGLAAAYLLSAAVAYAAGGVLLNAVFHLGALVVTYLAAGMLRRRFWP